MSSSNVSVINPLCMVALTQGMESGRLLTGIYTAQTLEINQSRSISAAPQLILIIANVLKMKRESLEC